MTDHRGSTLLRKADLAKSRKRNRRLSFESLELRLLLATGPVTYSAPAPDWFQIADTEHIKSETAVLEGLNLTNGERGDWIVRFSPDVLTYGATPTSISQLLDGTGTHVVRGLGLPGLVSVVSSGLEENEIRSTFEDHPQIDYFEPDYRVQPESAAPNDRFFSRLWGLDNRGQTGGTVDADIDALEAWDLSAGNSDVVVAVIDTGVSRTHPDLSANLWRNPGEIPADQVDNDGNGFVDDVWGWDFANRQFDPSDRHGHGTHVAGTIAAVANNETGVVGVAPDATVMPLRFMLPDSDGKAWGSISDAVAAVNYGVLSGGVPDLRWAVC